MLNAKVDEVVYENGVASGVKIDGKVIFFININSFKIKIIKNININNYYC